jgi:hypothetical protein
VSHEVAKRLAEGHYEKFRVDQDERFESDFEVAVAKLTPPRPRPEEAES